MSRGDSISPWFSVVLGAIFVVIGTWLGWKWLGQMEIARRSTKWPVAVAAIERSWVEAHQGSKGGVSYLARVIYSYSVDGRIIREHTLSPMYMGSSSRPVADAFASAFPKGARLEVHYDPRKPEISTLLTGILMPEACFILIPLFGAIFGGAVMFLSFRQLRPNRELVSFSPGY